MGLRSAILPLFGVFLISLACAQESAPQHFVQDWSTDHVVFTGLTPQNVGDAVKADPRAWHSWIEHSRYSFKRTGPDEELHGIGRRKTHSSHHRNKLKKDWQMTIGRNAQAWTSPAKFGFNVNATPDCSNDYVVFSTENNATPGASGPNVSASLIAFNNLYTGPGPSGICPSPGSPESQPSVLFSYNTVTTTFGLADLSPVLSLDGKQIAFIESNTFTTNSEAFHVLKWLAGEGTDWNAAAVPGDCSPGNSCMSTLTMSCSNSSSNPFIDYTHDTAYVGDDCGSLHKITPVFSGTPVEVVGNGWPVQLGSRLYSPVYDSVSGRVLVTTTNTCALYVVDATSGVVLKTDTYSCFTQSDVIVDSTNQTAYVAFTASPTFNLTVAQFDTSGTLLSQVAGAALAGSVNVFTGAFDHNYYNNPSTGSLYFAGAVNGLASLYQVGFTGRTMNSSLNGPLVLTTSQFGSTPGRLTEIFNPSLSTAQDRLFVGIDGNCAPSAAGQGDGCIESLDISNGFPSGILNSYTVATRAASLSISGIIMDNVSSSPQASSIYFDATVLPNGSAFKLTQSSLQ